MQSWLRRHPFLTGKAPQMLGHHVILALSLGKRHQRNPLLGHKIFQRRHEAPGHRAHQRRRRHRLPTMRTEKPDNPLFILQARYEHIEVHPVDPLGRQLHMTADDLGHALCYHPSGSGRAGFASRRRLDLSQVLETGLTRARHEPAIGATIATRLVGLRRSLASFLSEHDLFRKPVPTFRHHARTAASFHRIPRRESVKTDCFIGK